MKAVSRNRVVAVDEDRLFPWPAVGDRVRHILSNEIGTVDARGELYGRRAYGRPLARVRWDDGPTRWTNILLLDECEEEESHGTD